MWGRKDIETPVKKRKKKREREKKAAYKQIISNTNTLRDTLFVTQSDR